MADSHSHGFFELYLYLGDGMTHFIGDQNYRLSAGDIMLIDRSVFHRTVYADSVKNHERILVSFDEAALGPIRGGGAAERAVKLFRLRKLKFAGSDDHAAAVGRLVRLNETFERGEPPFCPLMCRLQLCEFLLLLCTLEERGRISAAAEPLGAAEKRVADIIAYLDANFTDGISLELLARRFYTGKYALCHAFKRTTGITVVQYLNRRRLAEAARLLAAGPAGVTEAAQAAGFNSLSHFNEQFRKTYGCTPTRYREARLAGSGRSG